MKSHTCEFVFRMPGRRRDKCDLPVVDENRCVFHARSLKAENFSSLLITEIQRSNHWLEGICVSGELANLTLSGAQMPCALFEGTHLESVSLDRANLEGAVFRSASFRNVALCWSNLKDVIFDRAKFISDGDCSVDFRYTEMGGASFEGTELIDLRLEGITLSKQTKVSRLLNASICEERNGDWETAASIYITLGKRAREDWDIVSEDRATFAAMSCRHRRAIDSGPRGDSYMATWIIPTLKSGVRGLWWYLQRTVWGYGYRPLRLVSFMLLTIVLFSSLFTFFYHHAGQRINSSLLNGFLLSIQSFTTVTYGKSIPANKLCEILGSFEAFFGTILVSLLIVSLAARFMRRI